jgi:hypothetical protein
MKKILTILTIATMMIATVSCFKKPEDCDINSWCIGYLNDCDVIAIWDNDILTISGTGAMRSFPYGSAPWSLSSCPRTPIKTVIINDGVTTIGQQAFQNHSSLTSVSIPNSVNSIGILAFANTGLTSITIPNSVTSIGGTAFVFCSALTSIEVEANNLNYSSVDGVLFNKNQDTLLVCPAGKQGNYIIPSSTTTIGRIAFHSSGLTSLVIPNSVITIGDLAFAFSGLTTITIPNSVTLIGTDAFWECTDLTSIEVETNNPSYSSVDGVLFNKNQTSLLTYPRNRQGEHYTIPNGVTTVGLQAFYGCTNLTSVVIPNSVTIIEAAAFRGCSGLTSITIGNGVTSIGTRAFQGLSELISVTILSTTPPTLGSDVFSWGVNKETCCLYVPAASVSLYREANGWKDFKCINGI